MARQTSFTVHRPPAAPGRDPDLGTEFVPDSFSFAAFLVPWAWFLWQRLWLVFGVYLVVMIVVSVGLAVSGFAPAVRIAIGLAVSLLIGLEATNLKRWTLTRRGYSDEGVVVAATLAEAERRYFTSGAATGAFTPPRITGETAAPAPRSEGAPAYPLGLFPEADARGSR